jgi:hypothetical protein
LSTVCSAEKSGIALGIVGDDLAVDQARRQIERLEPFDQRRELVAQSSPLRV